MSEISRQARRAMRAKAYRLANNRPGKVDASDYGPEEVLDADVKTGLRPVSRRAYKKGGKVVAVKGEDAIKHAGKAPRKARKDGGKLTADSFANVDMKDANTEREGKKHVGGLKRGGRAKRADGGEVPTTLLNIGAGNSMARKIAGLKRGGRADGGEVDDMDGGMEMRRRPAPTIPRGGYNDPYEPTPKTGPATPPRKPLKPAGIKGYKRGGAAYEGTAKDVREDKKLAKKHHMTMKDWEASDMDKKHDTQRSTKGLKKGGRAGKSVGGVLGTLGKSGLFGLAGLGAASLLGGGGGDTDDQTNAPGAPGKKRGGAANGKWIQNAIKHPGALRESLHVPEGKTIPAKKLEKAEHSSNPKLAKRARLAETLKRMPRKDGGRAKGKTNINIIIGARSPDSPGAMPPGAPGASPIPVPVGPPALGAVGPQIPGAPPAMPGAPPPMGPVGGPPPLPRKRGGRTFRDMDAGAGSGEGRLEKTDIAKHTR